MRKYEGKMIRYEAKMRKYEEKMRYEEGKSVKGSIIRGKGEENQRGMRGKTDT